MDSVLFLLILPVIIAVLLLFVRSDNARKAIVIPGAAMIIAVSVYVAMRFLGDGTTYFDIDGELIDWSMFAMEIVLSIAVILLGVKYKKYIASVLSFVQLVFIVWFELTQSHEIEVYNNLYMDQLSIIMILIVGVVGTFFGSIAGLAVALNLQKISSFVERIFNFKILPGDVYYLSELPSKVNYGDVVVIVLGTLAICFLSTIYPSLRASRLDPAEALRYE